MKDYNYYKTIADICNEMNDVYKKYKIEEIIPLSKISLDYEPEEGDCFLLKSGENKYLMVETSTDFFHWVGARLMLYEINKIDGNFAKYLHDHDQEDHNGKRHKLFVFSYIEGEPLKDYLLKVDKKEAYNLGKDLGCTLKKIHLIQVDTLKHHVGHWNQRYKGIQKSILINKISNNELEKAYKFYEDNRQIQMIEQRYSTSEYYYKIDGKYVYDEFGNCIIEKTLAFIFGDIKLENLVVKNGKVCVKCPINIKIADPFYDLKFLSLIALESEYFASGVIDGYCEDKMSKDFFKMLKYYTSELIITEYNKTLDIDIINKIYESYDDFNSEIPKWYNR